MPLIPRGLHLGYSPPLPGDQSLPHEQTFAVMLVGLVIESEKSNASTKFTEFTVIKPPTPVMRSYGV